MDELIDGVMIKHLIKYDDERGFFEELISVKDDIFEGIPFGQLSHSRIYSGIIKAWHIHQIQWDLWFVLSGVLQVGLSDRRQKSKTYGQTDSYILKDDAVIRIPPGVAHGCKVIQGPCDLIYITSHPYNPEDEGRIPHDSKSIGYDWFAVPEPK